MNEFDRQGVVQDRPEESPRKSRKRPGTYGLLVVDDEAIMRDILNKGMRKEGFAVWLAANGKKALDLYRHHVDDIDMVLLDVRMPGLDGPQTLAALKEVSPRIRACFMSGDLGGYTVEDLHSMGAAAFFPKPFRLTDLARALWELLPDGLPSPT